MSRHRFSGTHLARRRARLMSPRACPRTVANRGADYPAAKEPWRCLRFFCTGCKLWRPWCCGAADDKPELCDDCAVPAKVAA